MVQTGDIYLMIFVGFVLVATVMVVTVFFLADRRSRRRGRRRDRTNIRRAVNRKRRQAMEEELDDVETVEAA